MTDWITFICFSQSTLWIGGLTGQLGLVGHCILQCLLAALLGAKVTCHLSPGTFIVI